MRRILALWLSAWLAAPASAIVVDGPGERLAETRPAPDPGWRSVGRRGGTSAIYLGDGWVLTANHSHVGEVVFDGTAYPPVPDSGLRLEALQAPGRKADLLLFRIDPAPDLPKLAIRRRSPPLGSAAVLIGFGAGRGARFEWKGVPGYAVDDRRVKRWGTNTILARGIDVEGPAESLTRCFRTDFQPGASPLEAQAAVGDSGGAVFVKGPTGWRLAGVMISVGSALEQPPGTAIYGNVTQAADLSLYWPQIERALAGGGGAPPGAGKGAAAHPLP